MGNLNKKDQNIAELEYCLNQYFGKHIAPVYEQGLKYVREQADKEVSDYIKDNHSKAVTNRMDDAVAYFGETVWVRTTGDWNNINFSAFSTVVGKKFANNHKLWEDLDLLTTKYREAFIKKMGADKYKSLSAEYGQYNGVPDVAMNYVLAKLHDLTVRKFSRDNMPKSNMDYVWKKGFEDSLLKGIYNLAANPQSEFLSEIRHHGVENYKANTAMKLGARTVSSIIDAPLFAATGGYGTAVAATKTTVVDVGVRSAFEEGFVDKAVNALRPGKVGFALISPIGAVILPRLFPNLSKDETTENLTSIEAISVDIAGNKNYLDNLNNQSKGYRNKTSQNIYSINNSLRNKVSVSFNESISQSTFSKLLNKWKGDASLARESTRKTLNMYDIAYRSTAPVPAWMNKISEKDSIHYAARFLSYAVRMNKQGIDKLKVGNRILSLDQIAQRAFDYANAAEKKMHFRKEHNLSVKPSHPTDNKRIQKPPFDYQAFRNHREYDILSVIGNRVDSTRKIPSWMNNIKKQECLRLGNYFYLQAVTAMQHKANGATVNGKWLSNTLLMQRAMDYYNAAAYKDSISRNQKASSRALHSSIATPGKVEVNLSSSSKKPVQHSTATPGKVEVNLSSSPKKSVQHSTANSGKVEVSHSSSSKKSVQYPTANPGKVEVSHSSSPKKSVQHSTATPDKVEVSHSSSPKKPVQHSEDKPKQQHHNSPQPIMPSQADYYKETPTEKPVQTPLAGRSVSGWEGVLDKHNSNSFSDVSSNLGYVIAMLPDMLINMFTGKNQNFRMENNILPIASIFAAMFVKNPLIKMLMVGLGGASLLKSAGNEVLSYGNPNDNKVYKKYLDEPLNSRLSEPAIKGSSLFVDIDNIPMVINISKEAAIAYRDGHLPLNTLANSVLVKYDQQKQTAETNYIINETAEKDMERQVALR
ncbi:hypothetical protein KZO77_05135 [Prevotella melaninogenica]|uniref:Large polyvalent protein associated domain-containing protein n=1 Tax=Prevotella melaninogenica TaxID=28132 RepID=A0ABS6Y4M7_9BACT|nr:hypothetical protein [Prevotella melaninogenica]MBW4754427.1 hypothetical protein [Prevotella melaninogenica]